MLNNIQLHTMEQSNNSKYHRSNRSSPALAGTNGLSQRSNNLSYHLPPSFQSSLQCSAYFISRMDLNDYTIQTLKQTIDNVVTGPKSKGLKVKLSLPDEGFIIENIPDPNQSWMYRTSELLYFWRDPHYVNIIIVVTLNRTNYPSNSSFSASIFRLRGYESVQLFLQRAQQFFARLSPKPPLKRSATTEPMTGDFNKKAHRKKSRHYPKTNEQSTIKPTHSEFDPRRLPMTDSLVNLYTQRTYSDTTNSSDSRILKSKQLNNIFDDDEEEEKMTTTSNYVPSEYVTELVRELKELRSEIAALKLDTRFTPVRSTSTSPMTISSEKSNERMNSSPAEIHVATQTDLSLLNHDTKIDLVNGTSVRNKRKNEQTNINVNKRAFLSNNNQTGLNRQEYPLVNSSVMNGLTNGMSSSNGQEDYSSRPKSIDRDSSSIPMDAESSIQTGEVISFRSSLEDTIPSPENIYENIPIFIPINSNQKNEQTQGKPYLYVTIADHPNSEVQQQYLSQLFGSQNGISSMLPPSILSNRTSTPSTTTTITTSQTGSNQPNYFQQVLFSDHLTNPLFNVDKQLLANTIANQFGLEMNSPDLQKLITNQPLFVSNKRTFANIIWPLTPEEESALCSSPITTTSANHIVIQTVDSNHVSTKSILKPKNSSRLPSKGQRISWDLALE